MEGDGGNGGKRRCGDVERRRGERGTGGDGSGECRQEQGEQNKGC